MDFIKLERVQPFATAPEPQVDSSSTSSAMSVSPSPSPSSSSSSANNANNNQANGNKLSKKQKKAVKNAQAAAAMQRAQKRANQAKSAQKEKQRNSAQQLATPRASPRPPSPVRYTQSHLSVAPSQPNENGPLEVDMKHLKVSLDNVTGLALRRNCNRIIEPNTLPDDIIPTIARSEEVSAYQNQFTLPRTELGKRTIGQLLQTFSPVTPIKGKTEVYSKLQFVYNLIQRVANLDKNFDFAIVCRKESLKTLYDFTASATVTKGKRVNCATKRTTIAEYQQGAKVYGVIYKHRKNGETMTDTFKPTLDMVLAYDSACDVNEDAIHQLFKGTHQPKAKIYYLCCTDNPDLRIHMYNRNHPERPIHWNTQVSQLTIAQRNDLLFQAIRIPQNVGDTAAWNDYASQSVINAINEKKFKSYVFPFPPDRNRVGKVYKQYPGSPLNSSILQHFKSTGGNSATTPMKRPHSDAVNIPDVYKKAATSLNNVTTNNSSKEAGSSSNNKNTNNSNKNVATSSNNVSINNSKKAASSSSNANNNNSKKVPASSSNAKNNNNKRAIDNPNNTVNKKAKSNPTPVKVPQRTVVVPRGVTFLLERQALIDQQSQGNLRQDNRTREEIPHEFKRPNEYLPDLRVPTPFPSANTGYVLNPVHSGGESSRSPVQPSAIAHASASGGNSSNGSGSGSGRISNSSNTREATSSNGSSDVTPSVIVIDDPVDFTPTPTLPAKAPASTVSVPDTAATKNARVAPPQPSSSNDKQVFGSSLPSSSAATSSPVTGLQGADGFSWQIPATATHQPPPSSASAKLPVPVAAHAKTPETPMASDNSGEKSAEAQATTSTAESSNVKFAAQLNSNLDNLFSDALKQFEMDLDALEFKF